MQQIQPPYIRTGTLAGNALLEETGPNTSGCLLGTPIPAPPRKKSASPFPSHCTKGIGRGRRVRREVENNSILYTKTVCNNDTT